MSRTAVVLFNLGGPDSLDAVVPFLRNLFSDPAIITLPNPFRAIIARLIAARRAPVAREIYARLGNSSPILANTETQARALERELGGDTRIFIAMRYWRPLSGETAVAVKAWRPDEIVLMPLYPQFSATTTASSLDDWHRAAARIGLAVPTRATCCYPTEPGFIAALAARVTVALRAWPAEIKCRVLLSAHGLPQRLAERGDPYQWQIEATAAALRQKFDGKTEMVVCYQSRVGPLKWLEPATDAEIRRAGAEGRGLIIVPIAFVSEHSETLVELDHDYGKLAAEQGVPRYVRVPTVSDDPLFIAGLAAQVRAARTPIAPASGRRLCPGAATLCGCGAAG
jgi:protoporphyrin/coproporphyrin ferrochelatase